MRLAAYTRVSTAEQDTLAAQLDACKAFASRIGGEIVMVESDKLSGLDAGRPGYGRVLDAARRGDVDAVVVWKLDRFGRDAGESIRAAGQLARMGVGVHSATEPAEDPFTREVLLVVAGQESRNTSVRVRQKMYYDALQGLWPGRAPLGYSIDPNRKLAPNKDAPLVSKLFEVAATGQYSYAGLRDMATAWGLRFGPTKRHPQGTPISRSRIGTILHNPAYVGDVVYGRRPHGRFTRSHRAPESDWAVCRDAHPALVSRDTFEAVARAFERHAHLPSTVSPTEYLLTGLAFCGFCKGRMYGLKGSHGFSYACHRASEYGCEQRSVGGVAVNAYVADHLRGLMIPFGAETRRVAERILREQAEAQSKEAESQRRTLQRRRDEIEQERTARARNLLADLVPPEVYARLEAQDVDALRILDGELAGLETVEPPDIGPLLEVLEGLSSHDFDEAAWRDLALLFIERVEIKRGEKRGHPDVEIVFTPEAAIVYQAVDELVRSSQEASEQDYQEARMRRRKKVRA